MRTAAALACRVAVAALALPLTACPKDRGDDAPLTLAEARDAADESTVESQVAALTASNVELSTSFTIGKAVEAAAEELGAFIGSQLPCADVRVSAGTVSVTYGAKPGACTYRGQTFRGSHTVRVARNDGTIVVDHTWTDLSNGKVKVDGTAQVTWDLEDPRRRVVHDVTWTRTSDGKTGRGTGDRTQRPLAGGVSEGIQVDGSRTWQGSLGRWDLAIEGVQMRWADPVPQAGTYRLATPKGRSIALSFQRVDADSIRVTLTSGARKFQFVVDAAGTLDQGKDAS